VQGFFVLLRHKFNCVSKVKTTKARPSDSSKASCFSFPRLSKVCPTWAHRVAVHSNSVASPKI